MTEFDALSADDPELAPIRSAIREFLAADRDGQEFGWEPAVDSWLAQMGHRLLLPTRRRGVRRDDHPHGVRRRGLGHLHRYVVTEELLAHGAPVAAHWFSDRQFGPSLLSYGSDEQRRTLLPVIAAGRMYAAIGMSEHGAGSDLAAVKTRANRVEQ